MFSLKRFLFISALSVFPALIYSCGGGGGGSTPTTNAPTIQTTSSNLGGKVIAENPEVSTQSLPSDLKVLVEAVSINSKGEEIDRKVTEAQNGYFSVNLKLDNNGGKIILTASAEGFNKGTKTIEYTNPSDLKNLNIAIEINPVKQVIVQVPSINIPAAQSANKGEFIKIAFFKDKNGITKTAVGDQIKALAANGYKLILEMGIPVSKLQEGTSALKISYKNYDPSNPDDYNNFPGENTVDGKKLVSFGFDWLDIKDANTGKSPFSKISSQIARSDLGEYYRILRYVDCTQLNKIKKALGTLDEDPNKPGIQFTFWAYAWDKGGWVKAGQGTFVNSYIDNYYIQGEDEDKIDTAWDYIIKNGCVNQEGATVNLNGNSVNVSCQDNNVIVDEGDICKGNTNTYVVVSVTNPDLQWKNLDYIKPANEKIPEVSCNITINDEKGNPISTWVEAKPTNDCMDWVGSYTDEKGQVTLKSSNYCANDNNKSPQAKITYYDPINNKYVDYEPNQTFGESCKIKIPIQDINKCTVEGYIKDEETNKPKGYVSVWVYNDNWSVYRWGYTDNNGKYSIKVPCATDLKLASYYNYDDRYILNPYTFNVNGNVDVGKDETDDVNNIATLKDIKAKNNPPYGYAWLSSSNVKQGSSITATLYAWDYEGDTPIQYIMKVYDENNNVVISKTGQIKDNYSRIEESIDTTGLSGKYSVKFIIADSGYKGDISKLSQETTTINAVTFEVYSENAAPVISYFYAYPSTVPSVGKTVTLYGSAYDIDSTNLTSTIDYICKGNSVSSDSVQEADLLNKGYQKFTIPNNSSISYCDISWVVSDGEKVTTSKQVRIYVKNNPPQVYIWADSQVVPKTENSVTIHSSVYEPDGENYTCEWKVDGNVASTNCQDYTIDLTKYNPPAKINVELCATDASGGKSCSSLTLMYGTPSNVNIKIQ